MQITTTITNVAPRVITPKSGSAPFTIYELFDHENTAWRIKDDTYNMVRQWIGQTVDMVVRVEQNGQWTNRFADLVQLAGPGAQVPASNAVMQAMQAAQQANRVMPSVPQGNTAPSVWNQIPAGPTEKDQAIHRQVAAKVAAQISNSPAEFWGNCVDLSRYFDTGQTPLAGGNPTSPPPDQAQFAMAGTGYGDTPPPHGDDGIPF